jgi:hypothetical protein
LHSAFTKTDYISKYRLVLHYLKTNTLKERLLTGELTCGQLIQMTPADAKDYEEQPSKQYQSDEKPAYADEEQFEHSQSCEAPLSTSVVYGRVSVMVMCSHCRNQGNTRVEMMPGFCTLLSVCGCLVGGGGYFGWLVPLFTPPLLDVKHFCSFCEALPGKYSLIEL